MAKIGRNDSCPCGSGKKHKKCCLLTDASPSPSVTVSAVSAVSAAPSEPIEHVCHFCGDNPDERLLEDLEVGLIDALNDRADDILDELLDGHVDVAEALCHEFLRDFPGEAEGLDLLSMVCEERGQRERALELLRQASSIAHSRPDYDAETRLSMRQRIKELEV